MRVTIQGRSSLRRLVLAAGMAWACPATYADTITLSAQKDNTLFQSSTGSLSDGAGQHFYAGRTDQNSNYLRRGLIAFDLSAIPAGSTITGATLTLYMDRTRANSTDPVTLHRVSASWGEGASNSSSNGGGQGAPAQTGDATWLHRFYNTTLWSSQGGDYAGSASATLNVGTSNGPYSWTSAGLVSDVQAWVNSPAANFGWLVKGDESTSKTARRFVSREAGNSSQRPRLVVEFTAPSNTGACCLPNNTCVVTTQNSCSSQQGVYQGNNSTCSPSPCGATGACCLTNGTCQLLTAAACTGGGGVFQGDGTSCITAQCPIVLAPFVDALPIPAVAQPVSGQAGGEAAYVMYVREFEQVLHRDLPPTRVWGYSSTSAGPASYPGPTILAERDEPVTVTWVNDLRDFATGLPRTQHYLPVDTCLHGPSTLGASARIVSHLHGGHVPFGSDGYPEHTILPGQQSPPNSYPNTQTPGTLWYHDHALGITRLNVVMGLAGFYLLTDDFEQSLGLPAGEFEAGLAIQDRSFNPDGTLKYPAAWQGEFFGDFVLVNGKVWPFLNVKRALYRFRVLNGSTSRSYELALSNNAPFHVVGTDLGLLPAPVQKTQVSLVPGERLDIVVDFRSYAAGTQLILMNHSTHGTPAIENVMKFIVQPETGGPASLPASLRPVPPIPVESSSVTREFRLERTNDPCTGTVWLINGHHFDHISEFPRLGTTEIWSFINPSSMMHPMHMHLVAFQVLDRQNFELVGGQVVPVGSPVPPPPEEAGWKDTVASHPGQITRVIARFENYLGKYPYHCHILEHEDNEMMRQFQTTCYANCDSSTAAPVLNVADFTCFLQQYAAGNPYANCDNSTQTPVLNVADFTCFLQKYAAGGCQ